MIKFTVIGRPQQRGSKTAVPKRGGGFIVVGGMPVLKDANKHSKAWMDSVKTAANRIYSGELLAGPIELHVVFFFQRPQSHFGSGRNYGQLKASAPEHHSQTPDLDKLVRCLGDALSGVIWRDDRQVCKTISERRWTTSTERAEVTIYELESRTVLSASGASQLGLGLE
jgi:crossover junction endodeoxyribonuclease RusA